jgi:hypothetical protein
MSSFVVSSCYQRKKTKGKKEGKGEKDIKANFHRRFQWRAAVLSLTIVSTLDDLF